MGKAETMKLGIENETLEFKKSTSEIREACMSISAMLNKHGVGTLYFGVKNNGDVVGQVVSEETLRDVAHKISESVKPQTYPTVTKEDFEGKSTIKVEVNGNDKPYSAFGRYYIRVADEDQQMTPSRLKKYFLEHGNFSVWEQTESTDTDKNVDRTALKKFVQNATRSGRLPEGTKADVSILKQIGLFKNKHLNNAGAALFSRKSKIRLQMAIFATEEKLTFLDMAPEEDNIFNLLDKAESYIMRNIHWRAEITGSKREEIPEIPAAVVREALANSFAHAIYNTSEQHEICIHPNMITIYNPGEYASKYKPEEYVKRNTPSSIRNELIAKTLYLNKSIDRFGSGFKRISSLCKDAGIRFSYEKYDTGFKIIIYRRKENENVIINVTNNVILNQTEKTVLMLVKQNPQITIAELAERISKTDRTVQRALDSLREKGVLKRKGSRKAGYWVVK